MRAGFWENCAYSSSRVILVALRSTYRVTRAHLKNVVSRFDVCDVDPLAVDVVTVQIPAAHSDALIAKVGTLVALRNTWVEKTFLDFKFEECFLFIAYFYFHSNIQREILQTKHVKICNI